MRKTAVSPAPAPANPNKFKVTDALFLYAIVGAAYATYLAIVDLRFKASFNAAHPETPVPPSDPVDSVKWWARNALLWPADAAGLVTRGYQAAGSPADPALAPPEA